VLAVLLVVVWPVVTGQTTTNNAGLAGYNQPDYNQQCCYHHAPTVKPEAANAVVNS